MQAVGLALLVLFFAMGIFKTAGNVSELKRPEAAVKMFIRFAIAKAAISHGMELMITIFTVCRSILATVGPGLGGMSGLTATLPDYVAQSITEVGFFENIPLWIVTLPESLFILVLSFLKSYVGVCMEGVVVMPACVIFSAYASAPPQLPPGPDVTAVMVVWDYIVELVFNLLVLLGTIKISERVTKELLGL